MPCTAYHCVRVSDKTMSKVGVTSSIRGTELSSRPKSLVSNDAAKSSVVSKTSPKATETTALSKKTSNAARNQPVYNTSRMYASLVHQVKFIMFNASVVIMPHRRSLYIYRETTAYIVIPLTICALWQNG